MLHWCNGSTLAFNKSEIKVRILGEGLVEPAVSGKYAPLVQWTERTATDRRMRVRILQGVQILGRRNDLYLFW